MSFFRTKADRTIAHAHSRIGDAEATILHSFTDADKARAGEMLAQAQRYLARAVAAKALWYSEDHDDYDEYPVVPQTD